MVWERESVAPPNPKLIEYWPLFTNQMAALAAHGEPMTPYGTTSLPMTSAIS